MLLGYNQERPKAENYQDFIEKLVKGIKETHQNRLSLMIYGSYAKGNYTPGRSDIDAILTFPDDVIIDKQNLKSIGTVLHQALKGNNIPFQVTVTDLSTMRDGRFNTFGKSFEDHFYKTGKILIGPDYRKDYKYILPKITEQISLNFNLRKSRTTLLFAEHDKIENYEEFLKKFTKTLTAVKNGSKQIIQLSKGKSTYSHINIEPLEKIKELHTNPTQLDEIYKQPDEVMKLWNSSITCLEEMIRQYMLIKE